MEAIPKTEDESDKFSIVASVIDWIGDNPGFIPLVSRPRAIDGFIKVLVDTFLPVESSIDREQTSLIEAQPVFPNLGKAGEIPRIKIEGNRSLPYE